MKGTLAGHGTFLIKIFIVKGNLKDDTEFQVGHTFTNVVVTYKNRDVVFSMEEMVEEAVALIDKTVK